MSRASKNIDDSESDTLNKTKRLSLDGDVVKLIVSIALTIVVCAISMLPGWCIYVGKFLLGLFAPGLLASTLTTLFSMFACNLFLLALTIPVQFICGADFILGTFKAIKNRKVNMSVLVFVGTTISFVMSLYITFEPFILNMWVSDMSLYTNSGMPFYETSCMLVSFIMLGEVLEQRAKARTNQSVEQLKSLIPDTAFVIDESSVSGLSEHLFQNLKVEKLCTTQINIAQLQKDSLVLVRPNSKVPADGKVEWGHSKVDASMITGESDLVDISVGSEVTGGTLNIDGFLIVRVSHTLEQSVLTKIIDAVVSSQNSKAPVARVADKVAGIFVPAIMLCAIVTFCGWMIFDFITTGTITSAGVTKALMCAVSVNVVSCACALGLATPTALTVGMGRGANLGVIIKDGAVLETMCNVAHIVFDKTGTLTMAGLDKDASAAKILRPEAKDTIYQLNNKFNIQTYMTSGDKKQEALRVADELGFIHENVKYEVMPVDKKDKIDELRRNKCHGPKCKIAFVGDGINDAPALAAADIGITLESGTDIALDTGDVVLMHNKLSDILVAIRLSKSTMRKIKQNLFWALIYNVFMIPMAAFGILLPGLAALCHSFSSVFVVVNSLLLKRFK